MGPKLMDAVLGTIKRVADELAARIEALEAKAAGGLTADQEAAIAASRDPDGLRRALQRLNELGGRRD